MKMQISKEFLSISQAAELLKVTRQRMHQLIKTYEVETVKIGNAFIVSRDSLKKIPKIRPNGKHIKTEEK